VGARLLASGIYGPVTIPHYSTEFQVRQHVILIKKQKIKAFPKQKKEKLSSSQPLCHLAIDLKSRESLEGEKRREKEI